MLTIFSTPKAFRGSFATIQRNAIKSWTLLRPRPEIILLGNDEGTAEIASELGLIHIPRVDENEYGTPLVSSIFSNAEAAATNNLLCYVNADIILMADFMDAVRNCVQAGADQHFLMVGRKRNVAIPHLLDFEQPDWDSRLRDLALSKGIYGTTDSDYFLFRRGFWPPMPPFAIGRFFWSLWFVHVARAARVPVIDATPVVLAVESEHDYSHAVSTGHSSTLKGIEVRNNARLFKGCRLFTTVDATHILTANGLRKRPFNYVLRSLWIRFERKVGYWAKEESYPYSLPLILLYRATRPLWSIVQRAANSRT